MTAAMATTATRRSVTDYDCFPDTLRNGPAMHEPAVKQHLSMP